MPFKIVRTIERGRPQLCIVPSQWENGGILKWPRRDAERLAKDKDSIPGSDWLQINCSVKRNLLLSYELADAELQVMLENTDTENEEEQTIFRRPVQRQEPVNLNTLAQELIVNEDCGNSSTARVECETPESQTFVIVSDHIGTQEPTVPDANIDHQNVLQNQSILFDITNHIIENQKKIMHKLASLSVQMEEGFSKINRQSTVSLKDASQAEKDSFILNQIKNVKDLEEMELLLSDHEYKMKLIKSCTIVCSRGQGSGRTCAYRFLDVVFSRDFLCECSWSGSARNDGVKVSLKCYKNTLGFFFEVINQWDTTYTHEANEKFFKNILKNSSKRKNVKFERTPTMRNRIKKQKPNVAEEILIAGDNAAEASQPAMEHDYNNQLEEESLC